MLKTILFAGLALSAASTDALVRAQTVEPKPEKSKSLKTEGEVRYFEQGRRIAISIHPQVEKTYDLASTDTSYVIDPGVQVGSKVETEETKDDTGKKLVIIHIKH